MCRWRGRSRSEEASPEEAGLRLALLFCGRFFNAPDVRLFLRRDGRGQRSLEHEPQVSLQFHARLLWARIFLPGASSMELKWLPKMAAAAAPTGRLSPTRKPCCFTAKAAPAS